MKNWIILMNIQVICFGLIAIGYRFIPVDMKKPAKIIIGGLIISVAIQIFAFAIKPSWFKDKQTKPGN